jgi:serine/threonine-protein kinase
MLMGEVPFMGESPVSVALKHMRSDLPSLKEKYPDLPQAVENILIKATAKNPSNRYDDAGQMYEDLLTCLDESRKDEQKISFDYIEEEIDQTKIMPALGENDRRRIRNSVASEVEVEEKDSPSILGRTIAVLLTILTTIMVIILFSYLIIPAITKVPEVEIPDVTGLNVYEAEQSLINVGLDVALTPVEVFSEVVEKGFVIKTIPNKGRVVKENSQVTIYVSLGTEKITLEDYSGQNASFIRGKLEALELEVEVIEEVFSEEYPENVIVSQDPLPDTKLDKGDKVILVVPKIIETYPDFVRQNSPLSEIQAFAEKHGLVLDIRYVYSDIYRIDDIVSQNRQYGTPIIKGATLTIEVSLGTEE